MREVDPEPIRKRISAWKAVSRAHTARLHLIERWRARLLEDEAALSELLTEQPASRCRAAAPAHTQRAARARSRPAAEKLSRAVSVARRNSFRRSGDADAILRPMTMATDEELLIGLVSISDRASQGVYKDEGIPALEEWFRRAIAAPAWRTVTRLIPDEQPRDRSHAQGARRRRRLPSGADDRRHRARRCAT